MKQLTRTPRLAVMAALAVGLAAGAARAAVPLPPPDWNGYGTGSVRAGIGADTGRGLDTFSGYSTHLGWYTGQGSHALNPLTGAFAGQATWKVTGGTLRVTYTGNVVPSGNPAYPYSFKGALQANGGTGRLSHAFGLTEWRGAYTGVPGQFFFTFDGALFGAPVPLAQENFHAQGQAGFTNLAIGINANKLVPYLGLATSQRIGPNTQTGTIRNLTGLIPVDESTFLFLGEVGPHPTLPNSPSTHLISTNDGKIYCSWTAIFTLKIVSPTGDAVLGGDGDFHVNGGTGLYRKASGRFRTVFVSDRVPAGADSAVAGVVQNGNIKRH